MPVAIDKVVYAVGMLDCGTEFYPISNADGTGYNTTFGVENTDRIRTMTGSRKACNDGWFGIWYTKV